MNLFLIGWRPAGRVDGTRGAAALAALLARLPFFDPAGVERWDSPSGRATLAWVAHPAARVGGVRYAQADPHGFALFSGRPFRWTGDGAADGRAPLDSAFYRRPAREWMDDLDGRCTAARYDEREATLELYADPLGAYPLFGGEQEGTRWMGNSAELVRRALATEELDPTVAAAVFGTGGSLSGDPIWAGVRRLPPGMHHLRAGAPDARTQLLPLERIAELPGHGLEPERAAADLVAAVSAGADWPGRPRVLQLSGGRDSRLVLAAALAADVECEVVTHGTPERPDARVARRLCARASLPHRLIPSDPGAVLHGRTRDVARVVGLTSGVTTSLEHASGYRIDPSSGALPLWLNGQGGEIARARYGPGDGRGRDELVEMLRAGVAGPARLLSARGRELLEGEVAGAVDEALAAGIAPGDVPDVFYVRRRMSGWAAVGLGCGEYAKGDTVAPLWTGRLLRHQLGLPLAERAREGFPAAILRALSPSLARVRYARHARVLRPDAAEFAPVHARVREAVSAQPDHQVWEVLDRAYVDDVLAAEPRSLAEHEHRDVWRLGTVFLSEAPA